jgi:hypothetical protein
MPTPAGTCRRRRQASPATGTETSPEAGYGQPLRPLLPATTVTRLRWRLRDLQRPLVDLAASPRRVYRVAV